MIESEGGLLWSTFFVPASLFELDNTLQQARVPTLNPRLIMLRLPRADHRSRSGGNKTCSHTDMTMKQ
jgi:hypothetical protein